MVRPIFHLQPEKNWINDPNGMSFIRGQFHMFYQHNPHEPVWGNMTWGHAVSPDMVHWRRLPHALYPDQPYDRDGVFSGCCVIKDGLPHILYTGVHPETVCLALGDKDGMHFDKYPHNPILTSGSRALQGWRDPYIWPEGTGYRMIIGSGDRDGFGFAEIYESTDLYQWTYVGRLAQATDCALPDVMWECPMFLLGDDATGSANAALFVSALPSNTVRTLTGRYESKPGGHNSRFTVTSVTPTDEGDCLYAPALVRHPDGRWIMFGWLREQGDEEARKAQGWQGMLSLPREWWFEHGQLQVRPAKEVESLRGACVTQLAQAYSLAVTAGLHHEIDIRYRLRGGKLVIELLRDETGRCVKITLDGSDCGDNDNNGYDGDSAYVGHVTVDVGEWSGGATRVLHTSLGTTTVRGEGKNGETYGNVRIFTDGTAIELYGCCGNKTYTLTTRAYPSADATGVRAEATGGCVMETANVYVMENSYT